MAVSPVTTSSDNAANSRSLGNTSDELLNSFMTLLVAQMQNQDPTNPMDNNQLTSQLAQFQTAAGIEQLNTTVYGVGLLVNSMQQMNATDWIGRTVLIEGKPVVSTSEDGNQDFSFSLGSDADKVTVTLTDDEGNTYVGTLKDVKAGIHTYSLDDLTDFQPTDPREQADTTFTVSYSAITESGDSPKIMELKPAQVESVSFSQTGAVLHLGIDGIAMLNQIFLVQ